MFLFRQQAAELRGTLFSIAALFFIFLYSLFLNFHLGLGQCEQKFYTFHVFSLFPQFSFPQLSPQHCQTWVTGWFWNIKKLHGSWIAVILSGKSCTTILLTSNPTRFSARLLVVHIGCVISAISATGSEEDEGKTEEATVSLLPPLKRSV